MVTPDRALPNSTAPNASVRQPRYQAFLIGALLCMTSAFVTAPEAAAADPDESLAGPDIRIILEEERTLYEFRQNGQLRMVRVEPRIGKPYYLVPRDPTKGFGDLMRADMLLPSWVLVRF